MIDHYQETNSVVFALPHEFRTCSKIAASSGPCIPSKEYEVKTKQLSARPFFIEQLDAHPLFTEPSNETIGGSFKARFLLLPEYSSLVGCALDTIHQTENQYVAKEARKLLSIIQGAIASFKQFGVDLDYLPPLQAFNVDDGSVLIEWIFSNFRIGFNIEPNSEDSGWYLVSNENLGEISASGYTSSIDITLIVFWLLNFALSNS